MMLGVLERRAGVRLATADCFVATVGGVRLAEPATDMAVALAIASSAADAALPKGLVAFGEIGLAGDVRPIGSLDRRLAEAHRLGFTDAITPSRALRAHGGGVVPPPGMTVHEVGTIHEAIALAGRGLTARKERGYA
jgi:DNA repair protein RadA/Sms